MNGEGRLVSANLPKLQGNAMATMLGRSHCPVAAYRAIGSAILQIPTKPAMHSNLKPATYSDAKPASVPI